MHAWKTGLTKNEHEVKGVEDGYVDLENEKGDK